MMCQLCPIFPAACLLEFLRSVSALQNDMYALQEACTHPLPEHPPSKNSQSKFSNVTRPVVFCGTNMLYLYYMDYMNYKR